MSTKTDFTQALHALEKKAGGRIGVAALDTTSGNRLAYRANESFAMCSTYKLLAAAAVLAQVDKGKLGLGDDVHYALPDMKPYSPITQKHLHEGKMTVAELIAASLQHSDNTAANLLYPSVGGPKGLTAYIHMLGDKVTRFDRVEVALNSNKPGDARDTTTPDAMVDSMKTVLLGEALSPGARQKLIGWMLGNTTGQKRLRAGLNPEWKLGDKTGTGNNGATNDVAIALPPGRKPLLIAVFYSESKTSLETREEVIAEVGRMIAKEF